MRLANHIKLSVFHKEGEEESLLISKFAGFVPFDMEQEKIELKRSTAHSFNEKKIRIFEINLNKERYVNKFLENLNKMLNEDQKVLIKRQAESRLDNELNFFLRFDKEKLLNEGKLWLTDSGNCFHIKISIAAFPKKRDIALKTVEGIFS